MMLRRKPKAKIPERLNPGDPEPEWCSPGSIEQQLDMCEEGDLRGEEITHLHGVDVPEPRDGTDLIRKDEKSARFQILTEPDRENDDISEEENEEEELRIHLLVNQKLENLS